MYLSRAFHENKGTNFCSSYMFTPRNQKLENLSRSVGKGEQNMLWPDYLMIELWGWAWSEGHSTQARGLRRRGASGSQFNPKASGTLLGIEFSRFWTVAAEFHSLKGANRGENDQKRLWLSGGDKLRRGRSKGHVQGHLLHPALGTAGPPASSLEQKSASVGRSIKYLSHPLCVMDPDRW